MLRIEHLNAGYGRIDALHDVSVEVPSGAIVGLLGPNGAGKSTIMRSISGLTNIRSGRILCDGAEIQKLSPEAIVDLGIIHVPQGRKLFPELSIADNLLLGSYRSKARSAAAQSLKRVEAFFPVLRERFDQRAGTLSGGEQQMLAIGRALMALPKLLILDEPSLGLAPRIVEAIFSVLQEINREGVTVFVAEQNAAKVLEVAQLTYVVENGSIVHSGTGEELSSSKIIQESYLGMAR